MSVTAGLFPETIPPATPRAGVWYRVRWLKVERLPSPSQRYIRRLCGEIVWGPLAGVPVWKPITEDLRGLDQVQRFLLSLGLRWPARRHFEPYLEYMGRLLDLWVGLGPFEATVYAYKREWETFWTVRKVRRAAKEVQSDG